VQSGTLAGWNILCATDWNTQIDSKSCAAYFTNCILSNYYLSESATRPNSDRVALISFPISRHKTSPPACLKKIWANRIVSNHP